MRNCEKCGKLLRQEYAVFWRVCRGCRGIAQNDDKEYSHISDIATLEEVALRNGEPVADKERSLITVMRIATVFVFGLLGLGGMFVGISSAGDNLGLAFLLVIGSLACSFLGVALMMLFLDMAHNVSVIRRISEKLEKH